MHHYALLIEKKLPSFEPLSNWSGPYSDPLLEQATLFGVLATAIGCAMLIVHVANKRAVENKP